MAAAPIHDLPELRQRTGVFHDREAAGRVLAQMLESWHGSNALVLGIPAGGVPVAAGMARELGLPLDVAVVSKILLPWTSEAGFGAVGFDGTVWINPEYVAHYGLDAETIERQTRAAVEKVRRRVARFRGRHPWPDLRQRPVILVDDGLAAGSTLRVAAQALRRQGASPLIIAIPTGPASSLTALADQADEIYCANVRSGPYFAVADAYQHWTDVSEEEVEALLQTFQSAEGA
ncbi:phosphoribosyltransferase family protein [Thiohalobacter sp. IOR34]|uniref:phosphoribosyltransferase n=1 Tax=Thiohalobacter sp. IOR34 TaxID=3057176 RepID=UPI0025B27B4E|nr:phosphoribosyltransferase family protein [Thiohalobacter sp. IOR34]WJW75109.1 phosphoribosyltransferase family protein [Thiohalobacter sp. IOR34]